MNQDIFSIGVDCKPRLKKHEEIRLREKIKKRKNSLGECTKDKTRKEKN
jgi:hypothetical protein